MGSGVSGPGAREALQRLQLTVNAAEMQPPTVIASLANTPTPSVMVVQQTDATKTAVEKLMKQVPVFLHPNPAARAAMSIGTSVAKLRKTAAEKRYPHPVGELGDQLLKLDGLAPDSPFGQALRETGDALTQINEASHQMVRW